MIPNVCPWFFWMFDKSWHLASSQSLQNAVPQFQVHCVTECCCTLFHACWLKIVLYKANQSHLHYDSNSSILRNRPKKAAYQFWLMKMCPNTPQSSSKKIVFDSKNRPLLGRQLQAFRWARATLLSHLLRKIGMEASDTEGWMEFSSKVGRLGHLSHGFREIRKTLDPLPPSIWKFEVQDVFPYASRMLHSKWNLLFHEIPSTILFLNQSWRSPWDPLRCQDVLAFHGWCMPFGGLRFQGFQEVGTLREALSI